ncbi:hypothetical protein WOLCODRAFT_81131 [Wolfiporia cocos MD-104 SS10]|uniref:Uncharacterized protein n=1 Tax=Wolfiporia cocos (strain MD-104) TaxID=742152 RepID=A0A2H3JAU5_WOLCO|nr:hypothetical protein WOLCODRAFT_81131 [Wolfiporia cocos MD-104 SS10]
MFSLRPAPLEGDSYARTPGRVLKGVRQENLYRVPLTMNAKGKGAHTPHFSHTQKAGRSGAKPSIKNARPLLDKTPFPNRVASAIPLQTPAPKSGKLAKLVLQDEPAQDALPAALLRPSSARKSIRLLKSSIQGKAQEFKTPITRGNHWDVSEDDVQMDEGVITEGKNAGEEEDYDEIEYMPPSAIIETYQPLFEMPDYSVAGKMLLELAHSAKIDDTLDLYYAQDIDKQIDVPALWVASGFASSPSKWERLPLSELGARGSVRLTASLLR